MLWTLFNLLSGNKGNQFLKGLLDQVLGLAGINTTATMQGLSDKYLGTTYNSDRQRSEDMAYNMAESEKQRAWEESMMDKANAYNSYGNQMQLMRQAGLNPSLMMSGGQMAGATATVPSGAEASYNGAVGLGSGSLADLLKLPSEIERNKAQAEETLSRVPLNEQRVREVRQKVANLVTQSGLLSNELKVSAETLQAKIDSLTAQYGAEKSEAEFRGAKAAEEKKYLGEMVKGYRDKLVAEIDALEKKAGADSAQAGYLGSLKSQIDQQVNYFKTIYEDNSGFYEVMAKVQAVVSTLSTLVSAIAPFIPLLSKGKGLKVPESPNNWQNISVGS